MCGWREIFHFLSLTAAEEKLSTNRCLSLPRRPSVVVPLTVADWLCYYATVYVVLLWYNMAQVEI